MRPMSLFILMFLASSASASEPALATDAAAKKAAFLLQQTAPSDAYADRGTQTFRTQVTCPTLPFMGTEVLLRLNPSGSPTLVVFATMKSGDPKFEFMTVSMIDEGADGTVDRVDGVGAESRKVYDGSNAFQLVLNCYVATK